MLKVYAAGVGWTTSAAVSMSEVQIALCMTAWFRYNVQLLFCCLEHYTHNYSGWPVVWSVTNSWSTAANLWSGAVVSMSGRLKLLYAAGMSL